MFVGQGTKRRDHGVGVVADRTVAADQIRIDVRQPDTAPFEPSRGVQVEEHRAAADERLDVAIEFVGIVAPEDRQQLPLAARPLE